MSQQTEGTKNRTSTYKPLEYKISHKYNIDDIIIHKFNNKNSSTPKMT